MDFVGHPIPQIYIPINNHLSYKKNMCIEAIDVTTKS